MSDVFQRVKLLLIVFISLALYIGTITASDNNAKKQVSADIAIIGAGAAGTYAAWKLSQKYPDRTIHLYDVNNRVGGRMYSIKIPDIEDFRADLGAMRFLRDHTLVFDAIEELGLTVINFTTPTNDEKVYYLRGQHLLRGDLNENVPYGLTEDEKALSGTPAAMILMWNNRFIVPGEDDPMERKTVDGKYVYTLGCYNEWQKYGSSEALKYLSDVAGLDFMMYSNGNLARSSDTTTFPENISASAYEYLTLKDGTDILPITMVENFLESNPEGNQLLLGHQLQRIDSRSENITLFFKQMGMVEEDEKYLEVVSNDVILALGQQSILNIDWPARENIPNMEDNFKSVSEIPAMKIFLAYDTPWWRDGGNGKVFDQIRENGEQVKFLLTDLPPRYILDIGEDSTTGKSVLLIYNDMDQNLLFWLHPMLYGEADQTALPGEFTPTVELVNLTQTYLAMVFNISIDDMPQPYASTAQAWYGAPYYAAWHNWNPGPKFTDVQDAVMKPVPNRNVYIIGESYSYDHALVEGAYERTEVMLQRYYGFERNTHLKPKSYSLNMDLMENTF